MHPLSIAIPAASPFDMVVCTFTATLRLARPWTLPPTPAATPTTSLRGALGDTLASDAIVALTERFKLPSTRLYRAGLLPSLLVRAEATADPSTFTLRALLRGPGSPEPPHAPVRRPRAHRRAGTHARRLRRALHPRRPHRGRQHLRRWIAARSFGACADTLMMVLATPCNAAPLELLSFAGNLACGLVKLDRALSDDGNLSKRAVDDEADAARDACVASAARARHKLLDAAPTGHRRSGETGNVFPLGGSLGTIALEGDLTTALPWLRLMELHGVGGNTAFGLGQIALFWP